MVCSTYNHVFLYRLHLVNHSNTGNPILVRLQSLPPKTYLPSLSILITIPCFKLLEVSYKNICSLKNNFILQDAPQKMLVFPLTPRSII